MECMCPQPRPRFMLSSERAFRNGVRTHVNSNGKIPSTGNIFPRGVSNPRRRIKQDNEPNTLPTNYSGPQAGLESLDPHVSIAGIHLNTVLNNSSYKPCTKLTDQSLLSASRPYCAGARLQRFSPRTPASSPPASVNGCIKRKVSKC